MGLNHVLPITSCFLSQLKVQVLAAKPDFFSRLDPVHVLALA